MLPTDFETLQRQYPAAGPVTLADFARRNAAENAANAKEQQMPADETLNATPPAPGSTDERLQRFTTACEALWPAIRAFGLCGSHPRYLDAVLEIGDLLGKNPPPVDPAAIIAEAQRDAIEQVAAFVASAPEVRGKVGRGLAAEFSELIKKLRVSHD